MYIITHGWKSRRRLSWFNLPPQCKLYRTHVRPKVLHDISKSTWTDKKNIVSLLYEDEKNEIKQIRIQ